MKYKTSLRFLGITLAVLYTITLFASNGTQIGTVGARSTAMGSNFRGLADDWSAFFFNPAGLTQLGDWNIGLSTGIIMPGGGFTPTPLTVTPFSGLYENKRWLDEKTFFVPAFSVTKKINEKFSVGLGVCAPFGLGTDFDLYTIPKGYGNNTPLKEIYESNSDHQVVNMQALVAYQMTDKLSLGLGLGFIPIGILKLSKVAFPEYTKVRPELTGLFQILEGTQVLNPDHKRLVVENVVDGDGSALSGSLGLLYKINETLSIGFSARYMTDLALEGTMNRIVHQPGASPYYGPAISGYFKSVPGPNTIDSLTALGGLQLAFSGATSDSTFDAEADLPLPLTVGIGVAYEPIENLMLTADISLTQWSTWDVIDITLKKGSKTETVAMKEDWSNTIEFGLGAEYKALDLKYLKLDLRGGAYMVDTPSPVTTVNPTILDPSRRIVLTGGIGTTLGIIKINLAGEIVMFTEDTPTTEYHFDELGVAENAPGLYEMNAYVFTLGTSISL